ncbi:glycosyltransferase [Bacillus salacetis]|uniref:Glycosyltransferase n=1 Tax=Bacillus salacetis TaxID=2315464 RepID=A0A3A1QSE1_9BACI|nr:glycosyltransferase [Bacillus salacetis]RIW28055.1 glycosyltransferase [Bacillus salacetis]
MRIVQVSTDTLPVPPPRYGGIQRLVHTLTEELINRGHEVFLFAPQGSISAGTVIPYQHTGPNPEAIQDFVKQHLPDNIDIIHDHTHFSLIDKLNLPVPTISNINININNSTFPKYPVYISRNALQEVGGNKGFFIYPGLTLSQYQYSEVKEDYLLFLAEVNYQKGIMHAIDIARQLNMKLIIAGPVYDKEFFAKNVEPAINESPAVSYIGEVGGNQKQELLKHAKCLLVPILFREPFGIVMIESLACGTPVMAYNNGSVSEVLGGFPELICNDKDEMIAKIQNAQFPDPKDMRRYIAQNFSTELMVDRYIELYERILNQQLPPVHDPESIIRSFEQNTKDGKTPSLESRFDYATALRNLNRLDRSIAAFESCTKEQGNLQIRALYELASLYQNQGRLDEAKDACFRSFHSGLPRAEFCCRLGYCFKQEKKTPEALFWFKLAAQLQKPQKPEEIYDDNCWTWIPHLELCVCYFNSGRFKEAAYHNEIAGKYKPNDRRILFNKELLEKYQ